MIRRRPTEILPPGGNSSEDDDEPRENVCWLCLERRGSNKSVHSHDAEVRSVGDQATAHRDLVHCRMRKTGDVARDVRARATCPRAGCAQTGAVCWRPGGSGRAAQCEQGMARLRRNCATCLVAALDAEWSPLPPPGPSSRMHRHPPLHTKMSTVHHQCRLGQCSRRTWNRFQPLPRVFHRETQSIHT